MSTSSGLGKNLASRFAPTWFLCQRLPCPATAAQWGRKTDKTAEDLVSSLHADGSTVVVDRRGSGGFAVGPECAVQAAAFHGVVKELVLGLWRVHFRQPVDLGQMLFAVVGQVVVEQLRELLPR